MSELKIDADALFTNDLFLQKQVYLKGHTEHVGQTHYCNWTVVDSTLSKGVLYDVSLFTGLTPGTYLCYFICGYNNPSGSFLCEHHIYEAGSGEATSDTAIAGGGYNYYTAGTYCALSGLRLISLGEDTSGEIRANVYPTYIGGTTTLHGYYGWVWRIK